MQIILTNSYKFLQILTNSYEFLKLLTNSSPAAPYEKIEAEAQVDEGVSDESDSTKDTRQGFIGPLLAQGGHHAHEIMPEFVEVPSVSHRCHLPVSV